MRLGHTITRNRWQYESLLMANQPRCGDKGPNNATCVLLPEHEGDEHEGNGFDTFGPLYRAWQARHDHETTTDSETA